MAPACITQIWMISPYSRIKHACICGDTQQHKACGDTQQHKAAIFLIHDHYLIQIPVPWPLALNYLTSSPSDHRYAHQRNHYVLLVLLVLQTILCIIIISSTSRAATLLPHRRWVPLVQFVLAHMQCLPCFFQHLKVAQRLEQILTAFTLHIIMFYAWCLPCTLLSLDFLNSIQTQLKLWVHMTCINPSLWLSCGQSLFCTKGKGLGHGYKATYCPGI